MLVKALCTIHDGNGWHKAGDIFEADEILEGATVPAEAKAEAPVTEPENPVEEPKSKTTRRKKVSE